MKPRKTRQWRKPEELQIEDKIVLSIAIALKQRLIWRELYH